MNYNRKLMISGFALLLFAILIAVMSGALLSYIVGGLGLCFVLFGCYAEGSGERKE